MSHRKALSKKRRFEILTRDNFTCQYCGAMAPDAVLHIDHVCAVANRGSNAPTNLVTACSACNSGKGAVSLAHKIAARPYVLLASTLSRFAALSLPDAVSDQLPIHVHVGSVVQGLLRQHPEFARSQ